MLVLVLDTSTPAVTAGVAETTGPGDARVVAERVTVDARAHAELLAPQIADVLGGRRPDVIVCGVGPGPFTGLRVGMVTAVALGDAYGVPVHGVCSLDAIAAEAAAGADPGGDGALLVATDARRREVYWAVYRAGERVAGPLVDRPADVAARLAELGVTRTAGANPHADVLGVPVGGPPYPTVAGLVAAAGDLTAAPGPFAPLYLRRPDATEPAASKPVTV